MKHNFDEIWAEAAEFEAQYRTAIQRSNNRIFKALTKSKGKAFVKHLKIAMEEWEADTLAFSRKTRGSMQKEDFGPIKSVWVDQYSSGDSGDCFYGHIYIEIRKPTLTKPALYLEIHYAD